MLPAFLLQYFNRNMSCKELIHIFTVIKKMQNSLKNNHT